MKKHKHYRSFETDEWEDDFDFDQRKRNKNRNRKENIKEKSRYKDRLFDDE
jgi:hypothetical protein